MPKKLQSDDDNLMKIFEHYAELRRERAEYEDAVHTLECDVASLQGRVDQLEELNNNSPRSVIISWNVITGWSRNSS